MGKNISQPDFGKKNYITFLFKLKSKPAALYQSLVGSLSMVNLTKLQSYPEKNTFDSFLFFM